jgi:hypothetical protein
LLFRHKGKLEYRHGQQIGVLEPEDALTFPRRTLRELAGPVCQDSLHDTMTFTHFLFGARPGLGHTGVENMRHAAVFVMLLALPSSVMAELEFLTVEEIFQVISFVAAHPAAPVNYVTVSPFGPEPDETRMPETFAGLAKGILHCYHHTARYRVADVAQIPWDRQGQYSPSDNSALIRIRYFGAASDDPYEMNVALVSRQAQLRTAVVNDNSPILPNANCRLENWTTLKP